MTPPDVERHLIAIARTALEDPEAASAHERKLLRHVLTTIGEDATTSGALARAALRAWELRFRRCA
jgi:hypothetical protein